MRDVCRGLMMKGRRWLSRRSGHWRKFGLGRFVCMLMRVGLFVVFMVLGVVLFGVCGLCRVVVRGKGCGMSRGGSMFCRVMRGAVFRVCVCMLMRVGLFVVFMVLGVVWVMVFMVFMVLGVVLGGMRR